MDMVTAVREDERGTRPTHTHLKSFSTNKHCVGLAL